MAARQSAPVIGVQCAGSEPAGSGDGGFFDSGRWQLSVGLRKQRSHRHFVGTEEQTQRAEDGTEVVNNIYLIDVPCATVMPKMQKLQQEFANSGIVVLGINSWENGDALALMTKKGHSYGLLLNGEQIAEAYKVTSLPVVYIVGLDGKIIYCHAGENHKELSGVIEKHLKANGTPKPFKALRQHPY